MDSVHTYISYVYIIYWEINKSNLLHKKKICQIDQFTLLENNFKFKNYNYNLNLKISVKYLK